VRGIAGRYASDTRESAAARAHPPGNQGHPSEQYPCSVLHLGGTVKAWTVRDPEKLEPGVFPFNLPDSDHLGTVRDRGIHPPQRLLVLKLPAADAGVHQQD